MYEIRVQDWNRKTSTYSAPTEDKAKEIIKRERSSKWVAAIFVSKNGGRSKKVYSAKASDNPNLKPKKDFR